MSSTVQSNTNVSANIIKVNFNLTANQTCQISTEIVNEIPTGDLSSSVYLVVVPVVNTIQQISVSNQTTVERQTTTTGHQINVDQVTTVDQAATAERQTTFMRKFQEKINQDPELVRIRREIADREEQLSKLPYTPLIPPNFSSTVKSSNNPSESPSLASILRLPPRTVAI